MLETRTRREATHAHPDPLDGAAVRADFPMFEPSPDGSPPLAYLDSASSSQKPAAVVDALADYYRYGNANIHRGVYALSEQATALYEAAREKVARFVNAGSPRECLFVRNTTEAINLVAHTWGRRNLAAGDLIVGTVMDHHSNLVPWQLLAAETGARLAHVRVLADGRLDLDHFEALLEREPKLVAFPHVSNALGTVNDAAAIVRRARAAGAVVLVDAAQSAPHLPLDVQAFGCDFLAFSGHKMLAPMGPGVLYGRLDLLDAMPPFLGGGGAIDRVDLETTTWADVPAKFEAGTRAVGEAIALGVAIDYLSRLGMERVFAHERALGADARARLAEVPGLTVHGPADPASQSGVIAFTLAGANPREVAEVLDAENVAVRAGKHCCQPLLRALALPALVRASLYVYNTEEDVDRLVAALHKARHLLASRPAAPERLDAGCRQSAVA